MLFKVVDYLSTFDYLSIVSKLESEWFSFMNSIDRSYSQKIISNCRLDSLSLIILNHFYGYLSFISFSTVK